MSITLIRGLPGSGKTTLASQINAKHVEADMFFENEEGTYRFDGKKIQDAHFWCQSQVKYYLNRGHDVVVSNTFITIKEMKPYIETAKKYKTALKILECKKSFDSIHDIPIVTIEKMKNRWEDLPEHFKKLYLL